MNTVPAAFLLRMRARMLQFAREHSSVMKLVLNQVWLVLKSIFEMSIFLKRIEKTVVRRRFELIDSTKNPRLCVGFSCLKYTDRTVNFPLKDCFILATDIVNSTLLYNENPRWMKAQIDTHDAIVKRLVKTFNGHIVANEGDSFNLAFQFVQDAINFALNFQDQLDEYGVDFKVRIGINKGPMFVRKVCGYKLYGAAVEEVTAFIRHSKGEKICMRESLLLLHNIRYFKNLCKH